MILNDREEDRYAAVVISPCVLLAEMFTPSRLGFSTRVLEGLPVGTEFIGFEYSHDWAGYYSDAAAAVFVFKHGSFPIIPLGEPLTIVTPVFQSVYYPEDAA